MKTKLRCRHCWKSGRVKFRIYCWTHPMQGCAGVLRLTRHWWAGRRACWRGWCRTARTRPGTTESCAESQTATWRKDEQKTRWGHRNLGFLCRSQKFTCTFKRSPTVHDFAWFTVQISSVMLSWPLCGLGVVRLIQISTVLIPLLPLESMLTSVIGITALTVAALLTALLFQKLVI